MSRLPAVLLCIDPAELSGLAVVGEGEELSPAP